LSTGPLKDKTKRTVKESERGKVSILGPGQANQSGWHPGALPTTWHGRWTEKTSPNRLTGHWTHLTRLIHGVLPARKTRFWEKTRGPKSGQDRTAGQDAMADVGLAKSSIQGLLPDKTRSHKTWMGGTFQAAAQGTGQRAPEGKKNRHSDNIDNNLIGQQGAPSLAQPGLKHKKLAMAKPSL